MPYVMSRVDAASVDEWKHAIEAAAGALAPWRRQRIYRSLEEPNQLVIALEVDSYEEAVTLRAGLRENRPAGVRFAGEPRIVEELADTSARDDRGEAVARLAFFDSPSQLQPDDRRRTRSLVDLLRAQTGFRAGYHLRQPQSGRMLSLTIWDNETALDAAGRAVTERPAQDQRGIRPDTLEVWQVELDFERERAPTGDSVPE
jgi:hypothetical protein